MFSPPFQQSSTAATQHFSRDEECHNEDKRPENQETYVRVSTMIRYMSVPTETENATGFLDFWSAPCRSLEICLKQLFSQDEEDGYERKRTENQERYPRVLKMSRYKNLVTAEGVATGFSTFG